MKAKFPGALLLAVSLPLHAQQTITPQRDITSIPANGIELQMLYGCGFDGTKAVPSHGVIRRATYSISILVVSLLE